MQYEIVGEPFPVVVCHLEAGEQMRTEGGSMVWMDPCMEMSTTAGGLGGMFRKAVSHEGLFQNVYTARSAGKIAFGSSFPGRIMALDVQPGSDFVVQKMGYLASEEGVELSVFLNKSIKGGVFGGEGFVMQRLSGSGVAFIEIDGSFVEYTLEPGQQLIVDTGNLLAMDASVSLDVQLVKGVKNKLFGGEGLTNLVLSGPGRVWLQTMPLSGLVNVLAPYLNPGNA